MASGLTSHEPPLVFVFPGLGGDDRELAAMRLGCAPAIRFVTVEFPDWTEMYSQSIDLDGLIARCMARINALAPEGRLRLAGYSFGGMMAYQVAAAFAASGRDVARLGLLDSKAVPSVVSMRPTLAWRWQRFSKAVGGGDMRGEIGRMIAGLVIRSGKPWLLQRAAKLRPVKLPLNMDEHIAEPFQTRFRLPLLQESVARLAVADRRLDISTVLFRCVEQDNPDAAHDLGWERHIQDLQVVPLPGNHSTFMKPANMAILCKAFVEAMAADGGHAPAV
jgi:thioesterase domain-containing protein